MGKVNKCATNSKDQVKEKCINDSSFETSTNQDVNQLSSFIPKEIWSMILVDKIGRKHKTGKNMLYNCTLASPYFRDLLANQRTFLLFPKVLEILWPWLENEEEKSIFYCDNSSDYNLSTEDSVNDENGKPTPHIPFRCDAILNCRLVCRDWNIAIKYFFQNPKFHNAIKHDPVKLSRNLCEIEVSLRSINSYRLTSSFVSHFDGTHGGNELSDIGNPFPGKSITFQYVTAAPPEELMIPREVEREGLSTLLNKYGHNLWYCEIKFQDYTTRLNLYKKLREMLTLMPNLRTLKLNCTLVCPRDRFREVDDEMLAYIHRNPLPELNNLQFLSVKCLTSVTFDELIRINGPRISKLEIIRNRENDTLMNYDIYSEANLLSHLKELSINLSSVNDFEQIENSLMSASWKLEKLYFLYDEGSEIVEWSRVFSLISSKWSNSLTNLVLQMPFRETDTEGDFGLEASLSKTIFQLPFLKRVKLIVRKPCCLDFLLPSRSTLERIEIIADYNVDQEKKKLHYKFLQKQQHVKFLGFEDSKRKFSSNILELFPKLNILQIVTPLDHKKGSQRYGFLQQYRFCLYKAGIMLAEKQLRDPSDISSCGLLK